MARVLTEQAYRLGRVFRIEIAQPLRIAAARIEWSDVRQLGEIVIYTEPRPITKTETTTECQTTNTATSDYHSRMG